VNNSRSGRQSQILNSINASVKPKKSIRINLNILKETREIKLDKRSKSTFGKPNKSVEKFMVVKDPRSMKPTIIK